MFLSFSIEIHYDYFCIVRFRHEQVYSIIYRTGAHLSMTYISRYIRYIYIIYIMVAKITWNDRSV